jgi:hypothetical protein
MMDYETLIYINDHGELLSFGCREALWVNVSKDVTGLTGTNTTLFTSASMDQDGEALNGEKDEPRDISIPGQTWTKNKDHAYELMGGIERIMNPKVGGRLVYKYKNRTRTIDVKLVNDAYEYRCGSVPFILQMTAPYPYWQDEFETATPVATWIPRFEFPIEIGESSGMEFETRESAAVVEVENDGDVKVGMRIQMSARGPVTNPEVLDVSTGEYIRFKDFAMQTGDVIIISTLYSKKRITLTRNGLEYNLMKKLDENSSFLTLDIGVNLFTADAADGIDRLETTIYHCNNYRGAK